jgi:ATP adenylyltransferase
MEYFFNFDKFGYVQGKRPEGCVLCLVREGDPQGGNTLVYRNKHTGVALNLYPYNPGHLLIFPLKHHTDIRELSAEERSSMDMTLDRSLEVLDGLYNPSGYNLGYNMGLTAGASIEHLHMHVIPRYPRELGIAELLGGKRVLVEDINQTREKLCEAFGHCNLD